MTKLNEMAEEQMFEGHACLTGDCPHEKQRDCFVAVAKASALAALESSEEVKRLQEFIDELKDDVYGLDEMSGAEMAICIGLLQTKILAFRKMREGVGK